MLDAEEQRVQQENELGVPLDAPWTKSVKSLWDRHVARAPGREDLADPKDRLSNYYWSLLQIAHKQKKSHVVSGGETIAVTTLRNAIAHNPKNPCAYTASVTAPLPHSPPASWLCLFSPAH